MKKVFSLLFIIYLCCALHGQTISGFITDSESNPISQVQVLIRDKENPELISEFTRSKVDGGYLLTSKTKFDHLIIEFKKVRYFSLKYEFSDYYESFNSQRLNKPYVMAGLGIGF